MGKNPAVTKAEVKRAIHAALESGLCGEGQTLRVEIKRESVVVYPILVETSKNDPVKEYFNASYT